VVIAAALTLAGGASSMAAAKTPVARTPVAKTAAAAHPVKSPHVLAHAAGHKIA
jgi:hypothetical protein